MRKVLIIATCLLMKINLLHAEVTFLDPVVVHEKTIELEVEISSSTVKWSSAGYTKPMVKIVVPAIADITLLDHRNFQEDGPCMTSDALTVDDVVLGKESTEKILVKVSLVKNLSIDDNICHVGLTEMVNTTIRGVDFYHVKFLPLEDRQVDDCR